jgi:hypothetical protein
MSVIPMQMGIHFELKVLNWIPAFSGMSEMKHLLTLGLTLNPLYQAE